MSLLHTVFPNVHLGASHKCEITWDIFQAVSVKNARVLPATGKGDLRPQVIKEDNEMLQKLSLCRCFSSNVSKYNLQFYKWCSRMPSPENPDTKQQTLGKTKCFFFLQAHIHDGNFQFSFYAISLTSKPNSLHLQIKTYIQWTWGRGGISLAEYRHCHIQKFHLYIFSCSPLGWSLFCAVIFIQISGAHLVLKGNYRSKQLFHGREESSACLPSEPWKKGKDQPDLSGLS